MLKNCHPMKIHLVFDIGGTWIKCAAFAPREFRGLRAEPGDWARRMHRIPAPHGQAQFGATLRAFALEVAAGRTVLSVVISTAGIVHPLGTYITACSEHLAFLREADWVQEFAAALLAPVHLLNDAEAALLGAAETGRVPRVGTLCCLVVGTGLGCAVSKDARHERVRGGPSLLGSIRCGATTFDAMASASRLAAKDVNGDLRQVLSCPEYSDVRRTYFLDVAGILLSAAILHGAKHLLLGGGLADAAREIGFDLGKAIQSHWQTPPPELGFWPRLEIALEGNALSLLGAGAYAMALSSPLGLARPFRSLITEQATPGHCNLHQLPTRGILQKLWVAETVAATALEGSLDGLAELVDHIVAQWELGGRIIYVGAGTSGRLAALDAVEIPCTFGCAPDRVVAVIAGGLAEAAWRIESAGEEDSHAGPDMILLQPGPNDTVVGISASGSAEYVRTALCYAKQRGAHTALLTAAGDVADDFLDWVIPLASGIEVVAGSTRLKAGTATKKLLNFLTTSVMARVGKLRGPYMVDMVCLNDKLRDRAARILTELFSMTQQEAVILLAAHKYQLRTAIEAMEGGK